MKDADIAIWARGVCKSYGGKKGKLVLDELDMSVQKGSIYGLLGASGCGKTTLLSTIVGSKQIDAGEISVLGKKPGRFPVKRIGYMPQDIALVGEFTVKGAIQHYGWLFGMSDKEIDSRYEFLNNLLELPPSGRLIKNLSGGQQRRVSLAVVLVHNPDILILDEPTVGLDPVLRQGIWDYLVELTEKELKTIIITTHYIEEARQAHKIGLMRNGRLLAEGGPEQLMARFNCTNIEDVFLLLSRKHQRGSIIVESRIPVAENSLELEDVTGRDEKANCDVNSNAQYCDEDEPIWKKILKNLQFTNAGHSKALIIKNYHKMVRNKGTLAYCFIFPFIQISLFFLAIGGDPVDVKLGIIDQELGSFSDCHAWALNSSLGSFKGEENEMCSYNGLSCKFLLGLRSELSSFVFFNNTVQAEEAVRAGVVTGYLVFHENFTSKTARIRENLNITNRDLEEMQINIFMDKSNYPISRFIEKNLLERYDKFSQELESECGFNPRGASLPINKKEAVYSSYDAKFSEFMAPGFILTVSIFLAVSVSSLSIVTERTEGSWDRTLVAGVSKSEVVIFHFFTQAVVNALQNVLLFVTSFFIFKLRCQGSLYTAFLLISFQGVVGTAMGTFISVISKNVSDCILMSLGMFYPFLVLSGICWPLDAMHPILRNFSYFIIPSTIPVEALANIINRGWGILNTNVLKGFYVSTFWVFAFNALNILILTVEKR